MLRLLLDGTLYPHGLEVQHHTGYPRTSGAICVLPGQYWHEQTDQITEAIERYDWCLCIRTADEEDLFDISKVKHSNIKWWCQTPREGREYPEGTRFFGVGFPPYFNELPQEPPVRDIDVFLSAQNTHIRRTECFAALKKVSGAVEVNPTKGFTQGFSEHGYLWRMLRAKVAPAPSGAVSPDSFRVFEALEAHAVPVVDAVSPTDGRTDYWGRVLPGAPFPVITDYKHLPMIVEGLVEGYPANNNRVTAFWMRYKRELSIWLRSDLEALGAL